MDVIGQLIEVKSLSCFSMPIVPPSACTLHGQTSIRKLRREVSGQRGTEQRIERYRDERGYGVVVTGELMALALGCRRKL